MLSARYYEEIRKCTMAAPMTPIKINNLSNVCVVCWFCFVNKKLDTEGILTVEHFFLDKKLKLTHERIYIYILRNVCDTKGDLCFPTDSGECQTCFRNLEKVLKLDNNAKCLRENFRSKLQIYNGKVISINRYYHA